MVTKKKKLSIELLSSGLTVLCIAYLLIFNMFNVWPHRFHSDAAASIIINSEARYENNFIPQDWYYKDGDLFHYSLLAAPFVGKENFSFSSHLSAELFGLAILLLCCLYFGSIFFKKLAARLTFVVVILCGLSIQNAEYLLFQQAYLLTLALLLLASGLTYSLLISDENDNWRLIKTILFGLVIVLLVAINPIRSVTTIIPLIISTLVFWVIWRKQISIYRFFLTIIICFILGGLVNFLYAFNKNITYNVTSFSFIEFADLPRKLMVYLPLFFEYFGLYPPQGRADIISIIGEVLLSVFIIGGLVAFLKRIFLDREKSVSPTALEFLKWLFLVSFAISSLSMIVMKRLLVDVSSIRYQIVSIILFFAWLIAEYEFLLNRYRQLYNNYFKLFVCITFILIAFNVYIPIDLINYKNIPEKKRIAQTLEANNIKIAYGTYWNSSVITVFSGAKVHVLPISLQPVINQLKHLSSDRLWRNNLLFNESALILTKQEYDYLNLISGDFKKIFPHFKKMATVDDKYYIAIYNQNLAKYISVPNQTESTEKIDAKLEFQKSEERIFSGGKSNVDILLDFTNQTENLVISSMIEHPFNIGVSLLNADEEILEPNFASISFYRNVLPGEQITLKASINNIPQRSGRYYLRFAVVRGGIKWYLNNDGPVNKLAIVVE